MKNIIKGIIDIEKGRCPRCGRKIKYLGKDIVRDKEVEIYECDECGKWYI